ncbi:MAG: methionine--tRNA ligase [Chthoniobacterales bacterium]|nr:methionine--tRNA ligase [Chthoniobacterales bacterium]
MNFFLTTAIDYTNGAPHIGHAYEKVLADAIARYRRLKGDAVFFLTGVDQHGQKVQQSAQKQGVAPAEFVAGITSQFLSLWKTLDIRYDAWAATVDPVHKHCVQAMLQRLWETGHFYKAKQAGYYSVRQEQFLTDKERGPDGEFGPEWGEVVLIEEENYFFKLAGHRQWLLDFIDARSAAGKPFVLPDFRVAELRNAVEKLSGDLCISRPKSRLEWGIELPFDKDFVTYVWFDALSNYVSFAGYDPTPGADNAVFHSRWPALHVIGKDILVPPHGIYWPIMLRACGFSDTEMPTLLVHGWWNIAGSKMSKSQGNIVDPAELVKTFGVAATRYYLLSDIATGRDADFSEERLILRYNTDLANSLGNLLNRSLSMAKRYRGGAVKKSASPLAAFIAEKCAAYCRHMEAFEVHAAIESAWEIIGRCNGYVEETAPWKLAKDPACAEKLDGVLYTLAEALRILSILITPIIPESAEAIRSQLAWEGSVTLAQCEWGLLPDGHSLGDPVPVFPRIESK